MGNVLRFVRDPPGYLDAVRDAYHDPLVRLSGPSGDVYLVLSTLARESDVTVHEEDLDLDVGITMRPEGPVSGRVRPRSR